jgi:hypothetical protein
MRTTQIMKKKKKKTQTTFSGLAQNHKKTEGQANNEVKTKFH